MDRLLELLARVENLTDATDEELASLRSDIRDAMKATRESGGLTLEDTKNLTRGKEALTTIKGEQTSRAEEVARIEAEAEEALSGIDDDEEPEAPAADADAEPEVPVADAEPEAPVAEAPAPVAEAPVAEPPASELLPVAASGNKAPVRKNPVVTPARHQPKVAERKPVGPRLVASGESHLAPYGKNFDDWTDIGQHLIAKAEDHKSGGPSFDGEMVYAARYDYEGMYQDDDFRLRPGMDPDATFDAMARAVRRRHENVALVASGGVPGPAEPRYTQIVYGQADRPLRDALPSMLTARGILTWNTSPTIDDIVVNTTGASVGVMTAASDLANGTKTVQEVSAPTAQTATVEAITLRLQHGNFADKFYPERMRAFMVNAQVAFARFAESRRLADIKSSSTVVSDPTHKYGAYRDLRRQVEAFEMEIRDHIRDYDVPVSVILPEYACPMLAADLYAQAPGDDIFDETNIAWMRNNIQGWGRNLDIIWIKDGTAGKMLTAPLSGGLTPSYDFNLQWAIFPQGTWLYLDGGTLDLGIVRDSTLNSSNRFQTFFESWEAMAKLGPFSWWVTSSLCASGVTQIAKDVAVCGPSGS